MLGCEDVRVEVTEWLSDDQASELARECARACVRECMRVHRFCHCLQRRRFEASFTSLPFSVVEFASTFI